MTSPARNAAASLTPIALRCAHVDALWRVVLAARAAFDANPTRENAARLADARQAWRDAE